MTPIKEGDEGRRDLATKMRDLGEQLAPLLHEAINSDRKRDLVAFLRQRNIHLSGGDWTLAQIEALAEVARSFGKDAQ